MAPAGTFTALLSSSVAVNQDWYISQLAAFFFPYTNTDERNGLMVQVIPSLTNKLVYMLRLAVPTPRFSSAGGEPWGGRQEVVNLNDRPLGH